MALLISAGARPDLDLDAEPWFTPGKVRLPDTRAARTVAWRVNEVSTREDGEAAGASGGTVRALDLIEDSLQRIARHHLTREEPELLDEIVAEVAGAIGDDKLDRLVGDFQAEFLDPGRRTRQELFLELLIFWVLRRNPAAESIQRILHRGSVVGTTDLPHAMESLEIRSTGAPEESSPPGARLMHRLLAPQRASPDSLLGQLQFLLRTWEPVLDEQKDRIRAGLDLFAEELAPRFVGPGPAEAPDLEMAEDEPVRYSSDLGWMPRLVLLAKNVYVWLDQLSRRHQRRLHRLDEIPEVELDELASRGITGLWLIGIWERSAASQKIKQLCGNPEAVASAYSLRRYRIAEELGGEPALAELARRAAGHGIRLAADMVPNHMGIDSDWVVEHPDWFLGSSECPFPSYSFTGPDFSPHPAIGIFLEDHYFDRSDAAVVFKRVDRRTGETRYIYHGNDGTSTPWNDTAQLDFLQPHVRQAVIETILEVAHRFPIIRFDAAMTLARRHFQRLWFPDPGSAGAIPSRIEHGMSRQEFRRHMPEEFWRQVVDRTASESPGTLLLAEAFWLMEGYFVRSLGMHRVYNSAFMNMVRDQENAEYRNLLKETLSFDPQILQRYVNFMSNPDEKTALEQFGSEDRYFGPCVMMATLPGLPMFAHGQFEGLAEKYGMEYRRAYSTEKEDAALVERHRREIVPLLRRRRLFAGVDNFRLFDLVDERGTVNEDVYAYSNGSGAHRALILYNNRYRPARGRLHRSAPVSTVTMGSLPNKSARSVVRQNLAAALELPVSDLETQKGAFVTCRDLISRKEYLTAAADLTARGLAVELDGFEYRVLIDFEMESDDDGLLARLAEEIGGRGVESLELAKKGLRLAPVREIWRHRIHPAVVTAAGSNGSLGPTTEDSEDSGEAPSGSRPAPTAELHTDFQAALDEIGNAAASIVGRSFEPETCAPSQARFEALSGLFPSVEERSATSTHDLYAAALVWTVLDTLHGAFGDEYPASTLIEEWGLGPEARRMLAELDVEPDRAYRLLAIIGAGIELGWGSPGSEPISAAAWLDQLLGNAAARIALQVNAFEGVEYLNQECLESTLEWRVFLERWTDSASDESAPKPSEVGSDPVVAVGAEAEVESGRPSQDNAGVDRSNPVVNGPGLAAPDRWSQVAASIAEAAAVVGYRVDHLREQLGQHSDEPAVDSDQLSQTTPSADD